MAPWFLSLHVVYDRFPSCGRPEQSSKHPLCVLHPPDSGDLPNRREVRRAAAPQDADAKLSFIFSDPFQRISDLRNQRLRLRRHSGAVTRHICARRLDGAATDPHPMEFSLKDPLFCTFSAHSETKGADGGAASASGAPTWARSGCRTEPGGSPPAGPCRSWWGCNTHSRSGGSCSTCSHKKGTQGWFRTSGSQTRGPRAQSRPPRDDVLRPPASNQSLVLV